MGHLFRDSSARKIAVRAPIAGMRVRLSGTMEKEPGNCLSNPEVVMSPVERLHSLTRDGRRVGYRRWFLPSVALSVAVHVLVLLCFVAPVDRVAAERPDELVVIEERTE